MPDSQAHFFRYYKWVALLLISFFPLRSDAVPIWFQLSSTGNMRDVKWKRLESDRFVIYHDERAPSVGKYALTSVESAYPDLSLLLGVRLAGETQNENEKLRKNFLVSRFEKVPLIVSTRSDGGGFANFVSQNLELQIASGSPASLYHHELVHRLMYEHMDPQVGPGGRTFSVAMIPSWWTEGLAEYLTESVGRLETAGVTRAMAQYDSFLSWDRLHSLYAGGDYFLRGYVTSGRLVKYLTERTASKDLYSLNDDFFYKTITPPFINAENALLSKHWDKHGSEIYEDFKKDLKASWKERLQGMPESVDEGHKQGLVVTEWTPPTVITSNGLYLSSLREPPYESALLWKGLQPGESIVRLPLSIRGSALFDIHPAETVLGGGFWTGQREKFSNGTQGTNLVYFPFRGKLSQVTDKSLLKPVHFKFSSEQESVRVFSVTALGQGKAFALASSAGEALLYAVDARTGKTRLLKRWPSHHEIRFANRERAQDKIEETNCITLTIDSDFEITSLERYCLDGQSSVVLPGKRVFIKDAMTRLDGSHLILMGWHDVLGLAELQNGILTPIGPIPEWADGLRAMPKSSEAALWYYTGYDWVLKKINPSTIRTRVEQWKTTLKADSAWRQAPVWKILTPPFASLATQYRAKTAAESQANPGENASSQAAKPIQVSPSTATIAPQNVVFEDATYRHHHHFTYPYPIPPMLGGWGLGVVSWPFVDEIERQRVALLGAFNFETGSISGSAQYINNRIFDAFVIEGFSREKFDGYFRVCDRDGEAFYCGSLRPESRGVRYLNYLRESGAEISTVHRIRPSTFALGINASLAKIHTSSSTLPGALDPQTTTLFGYGTSLSFNVVDAAFYMRDKRIEGGEYLTWDIDASLGVNNFKSVAKVKNGLSEELNALKFSKVSGSAKNTFSYSGHSVSLRASLSGTLGQNSFNIREIYQPYRTYLQGASQGLNALNYSLYGVSRLFTLRSGYWSYRTTADYSFPLWSDIDYQLYISYFEAIRGEIVLGRGGVALDQNFNDVVHIDSASAAVRMDIDIKGVRLYPSIAYGMVLGEPGGTLFTEIAFSQFF
jgi:hypothetical protein